MMGCDQMRGRRVLVVEDDSLLAMFVQTMLTDLGCEVLGPIHGLSEALDFVATQTPIDVAVLDLNLDGEPIYPVIDALRAQGVPIIFCSGYGDTALRASDQGSLVLRKPYRVAELPRVLAEALAAA
jgi:CheY-like chemotaxis protein